MRGFSSNRYTLHIGFRHRERSEFDKTREYTSEETDAVRTQARSMSVEVKVRSRKSGELVFEHRRDEHPWVWTNQPYRLPDATQVIGFWANSFEANRGDTYIVEVCASGHEPLEHLRPVIFFHRNGHDGKFGVAWISGNVVLLVGAMLVVVVVAAVNAILSAI